MTGVHESTERAISRNTRLDNGHLWRLTTNLLDLQKSGKFCDVQLLCLDGTLMGKSKRFVGPSETKFEVEGRFLQRFNMLFYSPFRSSGQCKQYPPSDYSAPTHAPSNDGVLN